MQVLLMSSRPAGLWPRGAIQEHCPRCVVDPQTAPQQQRGLSPNHQSPITDHRPQAATASALGAGLRIR